MAARKSHITLITKMHLRYLVRSGAGVAFFVIALLVGTVIASAFLSQFETIAQRASDTEMVSIVETFLEKYGADAINWLVQDEPGSREIAQYLMVSQPALMSVILLALLIAVPLLVVPGASNQVSGEIGNRGLRYILFRTERINIFLGRFVATYLFTLAAFAIVVLITWFYISIKLDFYPPGDMALWTLRGLVMLALLTLPYVALCAWLSTLVGHAFGALAICYGVVGGLPLVVAMAGANNETVAKYGYYLAPWGWKYWLFHPDIKYTAIASIVMLAFTAAFLWLGARHFQKRDL